VVDAMMMRLLLSLSLIASLAFSGSVAAAKDLFLGVWSLDAKHSKYPPGTAPKEMTIEMSLAENGIHYHSETSYGNGRKTTADYTAAYDGKPVIVTSTRGLLLPVSLKRENERAVVATYTRGFTPVATSRRVVSTDGLKMTVTTESEDPSGKMVTNVGVYVRQGR
jgi:hypothetical protein